MLSDPIDALCDKLAADRPLEAPEAIRDAARTTPARRETHRNPAGEDDDQVREMSEHDTRRFRIKLEAVGSSGHPYYQIQRKGLFGWWWNIGTGLLTAERAIEVLEKSEANAKYER